MDNKIKRVVTILILIVLISNIFCSVIYASEADAEDISNVQELDDSQTQKLDDTFEKILPNNVLDGIVGVLTWVIRAPIAAIGIIFQTILSSICWTSGSGAVVSAEDILFSGRKVIGNDKGQQVGLLDIDYFDLQTTNNNALDVLRKNVAQWYFALRNIAIVMLLIVLLYIGIRLALSTMAEEKAKYKDMIKNWITSLALLFVLHYLMIFVIQINKELVTLIYGMLTSGGASAWDAMNSLMASSFSVSFIKGWASLIVYLLLLGVTIALFIQYMIRLFTIGFLIVIAPLITITYSIDKIGDNKSQALDTWLKEFVYNVLIQPFHCIIYVVFVTAAYKTIDAGTLTGVVFSVGSILFIKPAEEIVKKIFGFSKASSLGSTAAAGMLAMNAASKLKSSKNKATKAVGKVQSASKNGESGKKANTNSRTASNNMNQANKGSSTGTQNTGNRAYSSNYSSASSATRNNRVSNNSEEFEMDNTANKGNQKNKSTFGKTVGNVVLKEAKWGLGNAGNIIGGLVGSGATGSLLNAYTGAKVGDYMQGNIVNTGRQIKGYAQLTGERFKTKSNMNKYNKAKQKLKESIEDYERDGDFDKQDNQINNEISNFENGIQSQNVPTEKQMSLNRAMSELEKVYEKMGAENAKELAANDAKLIANDEYDRYNKINDSIISNANNLTSEGYTAEQLESLTTKITSDIDRIGENYYNSNEFSEMGKSEQKYAKQVYQTKKMMSAIEPTRKNNSQKPKEEIVKDVNKRLQKGIKRRIEDGTIKVNN